MDFTMFWAKFLGFYLIIAAAAMVFNAAGIKDYLRATPNNRSQLILEGFIAITIGLAILVTHNIWTGWPIIITLLGVLTLIKGGVRIFFTDWTARIIPKVVVGSRYYISVVVTFVIGLVLLYFAFIH